LAAVQHKMRITARMAHRGRCAANDTSQQAGVVRTRPAATPQAPGLARSVLAVRLAPASGPGRAAVGGTDDTPRACHGPNASHRSPSLDRRENRGQPFPSSDGESGGRAVGEDARDTAVVEFLPRPPRGEHSVQSRTRMPSS
jgi:hypothetical protein